MTSGQIPTIKANILTMTKGGLDVEQANRVFDTIEYILSENKISMRNKWVSEGKCPCDSHNDTFFMIEVTNNMLSVDIIQEIADALEGLHAEFIDVISRHERRSDFLQLVIIENHVEKSI